MKQLIKIFLISLSLIATAGCEVSEAKDKIVQSIDANTIWIFFHFNLQIKDALEDYYYYGRVSEQLYNSIIDGEKTEGYIVLRDVRFWGDGDIINIYEDHADTGTLVFRIQDIVKMDLQKGDPVVTEAVE